jgi:hypothetical protein
MLIEEIDRFDFGGQPLHSYQHRAINQLYSPPLIPIVKPTRSVRRKAASFKRGTVYVTQPRGHKVGSMRGAVNINTSPPTGRRANKTYRGSQPCVR